MIYPRRPKISALLDDLNAVGILHGDIKFNNILSPAEPWLEPQICPRHKQVHQWRVIDFDRASKWNRENVIDRKRFSNIQCCAVEDPMFWGCC
ncbi:hypothetical protein BT96DRAFT_77713 [Gymnopus androsaceus JB14]|uniref:Protein kinase domain-containing protein n=1 Tax=Gymnopus androsaceus JB14 TaxID=1447944 RepID=A0A6A4HHR9_9AGAR|nr:hypothetical protein BT96DRAFT_77713 [Gymnopus androsaceus JB14]